MKASDVSSEDFYKYYALINERKTSELTDYQKSFIDWLQKQTGDIPERIRDGRENAVEIYEQWKK